MPHFLLAMSILMVLVGAITASHQTSNSALDFDQAPATQAHARAALAWHAEAVAAKRASPTLTGAFSPTMPAHWAITFMSSCADATSVASWISDASIGDAASISKNLRHQSNPTDGIGRSSGTAITTSAGQTSSLPCPVPAGLITIYSEL